MAPGAGLAHLPALDGVRGVAISLVLVYHLNLIHEPRFAGERAWVALADVGWAGVDLFFVLSGFLITSLLLEARARHRDDPRRYFVSFWMRRALRIFPLYYLFLAFSFFLMPALAAHTADPGLWRDVPAQSAWFWAYLPNFYYAAEGAFTGASHLMVTWSLGVEEQFYLLWPVIVFVVPERHLGRVAAGGALLALVVRCALAAHGAPWVSLFTWPHCRMDALLLGALLATRARRGLDEGRGLALVVLAGAALLYLGYVWQRGVVAQFHASLYTVGYTLLAVAAAALLWLALVDARAQRWLSLRPLRWLGRYAYGLYLVHIPVKLLALRPLLTWESYKSALPNRLVQQLVFEACGFAVSLAVAALLYHVVEARFLSLKRWFPR